MAINNLSKLYEEQYSRVSWKGPQWYQRMERLILGREEAVSRLVPQGGKKLLDLGCGEGSLVAKCRTKAKVLVGVDLLESRLLRARKRYHREVKMGLFEFHQQDLDDKLKFRSHSFDVITCSSVIEYTLEPELVFKEIYRILRPGGTFIIEVPNLAFVSERLKLLTGQLVGSAHAPGWQGGRLHHFTFSTLHELLEKNGFLVREKSCSGLLAQIRRVWPELLSSDIILVCQKV